MTNEIEWRQVHLSAVAATPWRNGGGSTRELLTWPLEASEPDAWAWRLSVAEVAQAGPFSRFEGVQRWFSVLEGEGVRLDVDGQAHSLKASSAPLCFEGEQAVQCALLDGPTQDFNLMLRRGVATGLMRRLTGDSVVTLDTPKTIAIYAINTRASVVFSSDARMNIPTRCLAWAALPAGTVLQLAAPHALLMEITPC